MSNLILKVLGNYNQELAAVLACAEQQWPRLCANEDELLSAPEVEERRRTLLLAMTYLNQLKQLLGRQAEQPETTGPESRRPAIENDRWHVTY